METRFARLNPVALGVGFVGAVIVELILLFLPMGAMHRAGMMGPGMMGQGQGMMSPGHMGFGIMALVGIWIIIVSFIIGVVIAALYNAVLSQKAS